MTSSRPLQPAVPAPNDGKNHARADDRDGLEVGHRTAEEALVARVRAGDDRAFDELVTRHFNAMRRYAASLVDSSDDADDVAQIVLVRLWRHRWSWVPRTSVETYLMSSVRHEALNRLRHLRSRARAETVLAQEMTVRQLDGAYDASRASMEHMAFADTTRALTARRREAVTLRFQCGMTVPQIATVMGISPKAVEVHLTRAMADLREQFKRG